MVASRCISGENSVTKPLEARALSLAWFNEEMRSSLRYFAVLARETDPRLGFEGF
jgi:hypothetical protein